MDTQEVWSPIVMDQRNMKYMSNSKIFFLVKLNEGVNSISIHVIKLPMFLYVFFKIWEYLKNEGSN